MISASKNDLIYFEDIGWKLNQFIAQFTKENNFSLGLFKSDFMQSFVIGDIITVEKITEYEILLLYVNIKYRKLGYASKLLYEIPFFLKHNNLRIKNYNGGVIIINYSSLKELLAEIKIDKKYNQKLLTDIFQISFKKNILFEGFFTKNNNEMIGLNTKSDYIKIIKNI